MTIYSSFEKKSVFKRSKASIANIEDTFPQYHLSLRREEFSRLYVANELLHFSRKSSSFNANETLSPRARSSIRQYISQQLTASFWRLTYYRLTSNRDCQHSYSSWLVGIKNRCVRAFRGARRARGTTMAEIRTKWRCLCEGQLRTVIRRGFLPRWNPRNTFTYAHGPLKCNSRPSAALSFLSPPTPTPSHAPCPSLEDQPSINR